MSDLEALFALREAESSARAYGGILEENDSLTRNDEREYEAGVYHANKAASLLRGKLGPKLSDHSFLDSYERWVESLDWGTRLAMMKRLAYWHILEDE